MLGNNIKRIRESKKIGVNELGRMTNINPSYISAIERGKKTNPSYEIIEKIAKALEVPVTLLLDSEDTISNVATELLKNAEFVNMNMTNEQKKEWITQAAKDMPELFCDLPDDIQKQIKENSFVYCIDDFIKIPVVGVIRAGEPILAEENIIGYEYLPSDMTKQGEYFGLKVVGDSMNNSKIFEDSIVIVKRQDEVENNEIAVVLVDGENATIKKFYKSGNTVTLLPNSSNPVHQPRIIDLRKTQVKVLGKVVKVIYNL